MHKPGNSRSWRVLIVTLFFALAYLGNMPFNYADVGQGGKMTRSAAAVVHQVAELESMLAKLKRLLDRYKKEQSKCDLVQQDSQKALCESVLRDLDEASREIHRTFKVTADSVEAEIGLLEPKADPEYLDLLNRMNKKLLQMRKELDRSVHLALDTGSP